MADQAFTAGFSGAMEGGAPPADAARKVVEMFPSIGAADLMAAMRQGGLGFARRPRILAADGPASAATMAAADEDIVQDAIFFANLTVGAIPTSTPTEIAVALKDPRNYPGLTAWQMSEVLHDPTVFPALTAAQLTDALTACGYPAADVTAAVEKMFPRPKPQPTGGVITYAFKSGQSLDADWSIRPNPTGPGVAAADGYLHYSVSNLPAYNQWLVMSAKAVVPTARGCLISFRVRVNTIEGDEVKFTIAGDAILRFTSGGRTVMWQRWADGFFDLAPSAIRADGVWRTVVLAVTPGSVTLFEEGRKLFTWDHPIGDTINPAFSMQVLTPGANLSFDVGDIYFMPATFASDDSTPYDYVFSEGAPPPSAEMTFRTPQGAPQVSYPGPFVRFSAIPLTGVNAWSFLDMVRSAPAQAIFQYPLRVNSSGGSETKVTLPGDNILRLTPQANWCSWDGWFHVLAPAGVTVGKADFTLVTLVTAPDRITLLEDGLVKYERTYPATTGWNPGVAVQHLDTGTDVSVDFGGIRTLPSTKPGQGFDAGLLAWWPLSVDAQDMSGHGLNGEFVGGAIQPAARGQFGAARLGTGAAIRVPRLELSRTDFTFAAWINLDNLSQRSILFGDWVQEWQLLLAVWNGSVRANLRRNINSGGSDPAQDLIILETAARVPVSQWCHVAITWSREAAQCIGYVNGVAAGSAGPTPANERDLQVNNHPFFWIGRKEDSDDGDSWLQGMIGDVRVYGRALTADEIGQLGRF